MCQFKMNRQTFLHFLEEPAKLYQLPLIELQGLVLEFPYSPNLRLLLLLKARLEDHPRQQEMLQQLASRTFDREHLHDMIRELDREAIREEAAKEERLELPDLNKLDFAFVTNDSQEEVAAKENSLAAEINPPPAPVTSEDELLETISDEVQLPDDDDGPTLADSFNLDGIITETTAPTKTVSTEPEATPATDQTAEIANRTTITDLDYLDNLLPAAISISEVTRSYYASYRPPVPQPIEELVAPDSDGDRPDKVKSRLRRHRKKQLDLLKHRERDRLKEIARQSVSAHDEVASETLAKLLTRQGQYAKAIKMYQRLSLQNPKKSVIFAGLIQELKEKL
ncbi:hypothetical protein CEQ90_16895 [Lewinellaceae bacterium SD302]|nr:hypothetical protein CEQ90_16895 [Lewinellaceae bacterium SD302]